MTQSDQLVELTADIVSSHVSNNHVAVGDLGNLISQVHSALARLGTPPPNEETEKREPAVSIKSSIKPDHLVCLMCGNKQKTLRRHLATAHNLTPEQYRQEFGLKGDYPMVAQNYSDVRRTMAKSIGLGRRRSDAKESGNGNGKKRKSRTS